MWWIARTRTLLANSWPGLRRSPGLDWIETTVTVTPSLVVAVLLTLWVGRMRTATVLSVTFVAALVLAFTVTQTVTRTDGGLYCLGFTRREFTAALIRAVSTSAVIAAAAAWTTNFIFGRPLVVGPGHCTNCGYEIGRFATRRCPECGHPTASRTNGPSRFHRVWMWMCGRAPWALAAIVLLALGLIGYRIATVTWPIERFLRSIDPSGERATYMVLLGRSDGGLFSSPWAPVGMAAWQPFDSDPLFALAYVYFPSPRPDCPPMRVQIIFVPKSRYSSRMKYWGTPDTGNIPVYADLTAEQTEWVIRHGGAPEALRDNLLRVARERQLRPRGEGSLGGAHTPGLDATPSFPPP